MARPYTGKNTVGESRVTQKNGVIYVYERTSKDDHNDWPSSEGQNPARNYRNHSYATQKETLCQ